MRSHAQHASTEQMGLIAGKSDFVDALICAADTIYRALSDRPQLESATVKKRIVLVTNFLDAVRFSKMPYL